MRLTPEDQATYDAEWKPLAAKRDLHVSLGDHTTAKKYRQRLSALADKYRARQLPEEVELTPEEMDAKRWRWAMENVERIAWWTDCGLDAEALQNAVDEELGVRA